MRPAYAFFRLAILLAFSAACWRYALSGPGGPATERRCLEIASARPYAYENRVAAHGVWAGDLGLEVFLAFTADERFSNPLEARVSLAENEAGPWQIIEAYGYDEGLAQVLKMDSDSLKSLGTHAILLRSFNPTEKQILFYDLEPKREYAVRLLLHRRAGGIEPSRLADRIEGALSFHLVLSR